MRRLIPLGIAACIGLAAVSVTQAAHAGVAVGVTVPLPGVAVAPPALIAPWPYYGGPRFYRPGYVRYGYPYGYRYGYGFRRFGYGRPWR